MSLFLYRYTVLLLSFGLLIYFLYSQVFIIILCVMHLVIHFLSLQRLLDILVNGKHLLNIWSYLVTKIPKHSSLSLQVITFVQLIFSTSRVKLNILLSITILSLGMSLISLILDVLFIIIKLGRWPDISRKKGFLKLLNVL